MNLDAIASAVAVRFNATNTTPPSGEAPVHESTHYLPTAVTTTPTVLVFPPAASLNFQPSGPYRVTHLPFPVRVLIGQESERPDSMRRAYLWYGALLDQPLGNIDLDQTGVQYTEVTDFRIGEYRYAEQDYITIEFNVLVHFEDTPTIA